MNTKVQTQTKRIVILFFLIGWFGCVKDDNFEAPANPCSEEVLANITLAELKHLYSGSTFQIQEDLIIEG